MSAPRLAEETTNLILNYIRSNIGSALAHVRTDRNDPQVSTENPVSYFIYPKAKGYKAPAIFVICDDFDFKLDSNKPNFIDAVAKVNVAALVEDRNQNSLTIKTWRYQSALHELLHLRPLLSSDNRVKLDVTVKRATFSAIYSDVKNAESPESSFRKEVLLECDVYHRENF